MNRDVEVERGVNQPAAYMPVPSGPGGHSRWLRWALALGLVAFGAIFFFADLHELWRTLEQANLWLLSLPVLFSLLSYAAMARSYEGIARAAGCPVRFREMLKITFVANTLNYLLATAGLSGFAARMYYFTRLSIPSGTAVLISLVQTFMTNVTLLLFIVGGFIYVLGSGTLQGSVLTIIFILLVFFFLVALVAGLLLFHTRLRRRTLFFLAQTTYWILHRLLPHRTPPRTHIWRYQFNLNRGIAFLLSQKREMLAPLFYIVLDWIFTVLILHSAFLAVRYHINLSYVVVGFAVGFVLSFASLIPGGLGVMEGSMAAIFAGMGVPFETAVIAVLVFRVSFYLLPLFISLLFLHEMFVQGTQLGDQMGEADQPAAASQ